MSQVSHPYGYRLITVRPWRSNWFAGKTADFVNFLRFDTLIREFLEKKLRHQYVADILIERDRNALKITLLTSRPGLVIGKSGEGIAKIRKDVDTFIRRNHITAPREIKIDVAEVSNPDANAKIVALSIADQLEKRLPFKRVIKSTAERVMATRGVYGVRITIAGRLGGAEMSRVEQVQLGSVPLQFIRADIDYAIEKARMTYGVIGIKVWINRGDTLENQKNNPNQ